MSKNKFVALVAVAFAFAFVATSAFAATWDFGSSTIKKGSMGSYAMNVQTALNACNNAGLTVDGNFGSHSVAALVAFQASKGLTADGKAGNMTKAALNNCGSTSTGTTTTTTTPTGTTTTTTTTTTPSTSGPFSINNITPVSGYVSTLVGTGQQDKAIGDLRIITGAGGSANLTGLNLSFFNKATGGDYQFIKYAQNVSIWLNGAKVGTLDASQFTQYNNIYSAFVPTSGATLNPNSTNDLQVSVSALPVIDSANLGSANNTWLFEAGSLRYTDSTGSFMYSVSPSSNFDGASGLTSGNTNPNASAVFAAASSAQSIKLTVVKDVNDSNDHVFTASATSPTYGQQLAVIDLQAQGTPISVQQLPVTLTVANTGTGSTYPDKLLSTIKLYQGSVSGTPLDTETVPCLTGESGCTSGNTTGTVTFKNFNLTVPVNGSIALAITGDYVPFEQSVVVDGAYAQVNVTSANIAAIQAYDQNNNRLTGTTALTGSTTGSLVYGYVNGITVVSNGTASINAASPGGTQSHSTVTMTIPFSVSAFGSTEYMAATADSNLSNKNGVHFCVDNASGACQAAGTAVVSYTGNDSFNSTGGTWQINAGQTKNFVLQITTTANGAASYRGSLLNVGYASSASAAASAFVDFSAGLSSNSFKTPYVAGQ